MTQIILHISASKHPMYRGQLVRDANTAKPLWQGHVLYYALKDTDDNEFNTKILYRDTSLIIEYLLTNQQLQLPQHYLMMFIWIVI